MNYYIFPKKEIPHLIEFEWLENRKCSYSVEYFLKYQDDIKREFYWCQNILMIRTIYGGNKNIHIFGETPQKEIPDWIDI